MTTMKSDRQTINHLEFKPITVYGWKDVFRVQVLDTNFQNNDLTVTDINKNELMLLLNEGKSIEFLIPDSFQIIVPQTALTNSKITIEQLLTTILKKYPKQFCNAIYTSSGYKITLMKDAGKILNTTILTNGHPFNAIASCRFCKSCNMSHTFNSSSLNNEIWKSTNIKSIFCAFSNSPIQSSQLIQERKDFQRLFPISDAINISNNIFKEITIVSDFPFKVGLTPHALIAHKYLQSAINQFRNVFNDYTTKHNNFQNIPKSISAFESNIIPDLDSGAWPEVSKIHEKNLKKKPINLATDLVVPNNTMTAQTSVEMKKESKNEETVKSNEDIEKESTLESENTTTQTESVEIEIAQIEVETTQNENSQIEVETTQNETTQNETTQNENAQNSENVEVNYSDSDSEIGEKSSKSSYIAPTSSYVVPTSSYVTMSAPACYTTQYQPYPITYQSYVLESASPISICATTDTSVTMLIGNQTVTLKGISPTFLSIVVKPPSTSEMSNIPHVIYPSFHP